MSELKKRAEAILFATGKFISLEEISNLCKEDIKKVKDALLELMTDYEKDKSSSLVVINEEDMWKLTTREEYGNIVRRIVSETELTKSQIETLAVIAFKYPIKQSDLIKIRTNKAYDHLMELEKGGFITRQKYGRSRLIKLTDKFFSYFDLPRDKLKERFKGFEQLADTIEDKEEEIEELKEEQQKRAEEARVEEEKDRKVMDGEVELDDDKVDLEVYDEEKKGLQTYRDENKPEEVSLAEPIEEQEESNQEETETDQEIEEDDSFEKKQEIEDEMEKIIQSEEEKFDDDEALLNTKEEDDSNEEEKKNDDSS